LPEKRKEDKMKRIIGLMLLSLLVFVSCAPVDNQPLGDGKATGSDIGIVSSPEQVAKDKVDGLIRSSVFIDTAELEVLESYPVQYILSISGNLPSPCHGLRVTVSDPDAQGRILVDVYSVVAEDAMCAQVLTPFSKNIHIGSFADGSYTLWVNDQKVADL
jgi:hypothetical protein